MRRRLSGRAAALSLVLLLGGAVPAADDTAPQGRAKTQQRPKSRARVSAEAKLAYRKLKPELRNKLDRAIDALIVDTKAITNIESETAPHFSRPHPAVADWGPEMALPAAIRMRDKFTDKLYRDTYIRWHLMWVVKKAGESNSREIAPLLAQLADHLPGDLRLSRKALYRQEPQGAYQKWAVLHGQLRLVVGYAPFQTYVDPPESLALMKPKRRAEAEKIWERCQELRSTFKTITNNGARTYNQRVGQMNHIVRDYQGELIRELVRCGDPLMLQRVMRLIDEHARKESIVGFDLLTHLYLAAFDGELQQYDVQVLREAGAQLARTAKATQGDWVPFAYSKRSFSDYAFHMVMLLKAGDVGEMAPAATGPTPPPRGDRQPTERP